MESIRNYILRIVVAAIVCSIVKSLLKEKTSTGKMVNLLCGVLMSITILSPIASVSFQNITKFYDNTTFNADQYVNDGKLAAQESAANIIKSQAEAYILDKAAAFGATLDVEVLMPADGFHQPEGVVLYGDVSPYVKLQLQRIIAEEILITKEQQQWIS